VMVGDSDGEDDRRRVGDDVGLLLSVAEGVVEAVTVGDAVGVPDGISVGDAVGAFVGAFPVFPSFDAVGDSDSDSLVIHSGGSTSNNVDSQSLKRYTLSITFLDPGKKGIVDPSHSNPSAWGLFTPKKWSQTEEAN